MNITWAEFEHYATIVTVFVIPTAVAVSHPLAKAARAYAAWAERTPAAWDNKLADALLWLCVGFEANADRASRFAASALPFARRTREAIRQSQVPGGDT